jgi:tetratricopeptide (TPR) repeat protein
LALARLAEAELIYARGFAPEATYSFKHALIQDAAYEALLKSRRRELHRRVAVAMTEKIPVLAETQLEVVARHWTDAGEAEPAIAAWREAADTAFEHNAFKEAEEAYRQALTVLRTLPESGERDRRELEQMNRLSQVLRVTRGWAAPEAADATAHAQVLAEKSLDLDHLVLQEFGTWAAVLTAGELSAARARANQVLELAERQGSAANLGLAHVAQLTTCYFCGDLRAAEKHFAAGRPFFVEACSKSVGILTSTYAYPSHTAWMLGLADTARDRMTQGLALVRESDSPFELMYFQYLIALLYLFLREPAQARICAAEAVALADQHGFQQYTAAARIYLGFAEALLGRRREGIALARQGIDGVVANKAPVAMTVYLSWLAQAQGLNGEVQEALLTAAQALEVNPEELAWRPDAFRIRGELHFASGSVDAAEADFCEAIALAKQIGAKALELRAVMCLARMLKRRGNLAEARDLIAPLYATFTEGFDTADLKDAKALLEELNNSQ